jgi:hypothetical protein
MSDIEKYKELYEYARERLFAQFGQANRIDQKAAMFLSAVTVLLGFFSFFMKATFDDAIPPNSRPEWCLLITAALSGLACLSSWFAFLSVLRVRDLKNLRLDETTLDFFSDNSRVDILYAISRSAVEAFDTNNTQIKAKIRRLSFGCLVANFGIGVCT